MKPESPVAFLGAMLAATAAAEPVVQENAWTEQYAVTAAAPLLSIDNVWGSVNVRTGNVDRITVNINERRSAPSEDLFERSMAIYFLDTDADETGVAIRVGREDRNWQELNRCSNCRVDYQFDVVVPEGTDIDVGTVVDGRVAVSGDFGTVSASNVNGPIDVDGLRNCARVANVNGPIRLEFATRPVADCTIESINGDITLAIPGDAGLDVAFDLFNGRIVSELEVEPVALPATVEHLTENGSNRYRIEKPAGLRVGAGGPSYRVSSLNGDVRIRKL
ncbi:MAG TPA: hypothetical protein VFY03_09190 [Woeseiaceae bacterium]|nr:hypothetical protein [Woeseiaceae bacterium]